MFSSDKKSELVDLLADNSIIPNDILDLIELKKKKLALLQFKEMISEDPVEHEWQKFFNDNSWILNTELVEVLEDRRIDTNNIADYLVKGYDGFIDIIELKRVNTSASFWSTSKDHDNYIPHQDLIKAITQTQNYLFSVEKEMNSIDFIDRVGAKVVKPRVTLIFGNSNSWTADHWKSFRILNSSYHNLSILTYNLVFDRANSVFKKN